MKLNCAVCGNTYIAPYRGWYDHLVLRACSSSCFIEYLRGCPPPLLDFKNDKRVSPFKHSDRSFRSDYERTFNQWRWEHRSAVSMQYEPYTFTFADGSRYVPDFLMQGKVFLEVKGLWTGEGKKKVNAFFGEFWEIPFFIVDLAFLNMLKRTSR